MPNAFNTGPIAPERNPAIHPEWYAPRYYQITEIDQGPTTLFTFSQDHDFVVGQLVRTIIPQFWGIRELDEVESYVISIPAANQVVLNVSTVGFNAFIPDPVYSINSPYVVPVGDVNTGYISHTGRVAPSLNIPGSFINISPTIG